MCLVCCGCAYIMGSLQKKKIMMAQLLTTLNDTPFTIFKIYIAKDMHLAYTIK